MNNLEHKKHQELYQLCLRLLDIADEKQYRTWEHRLSRLTGGIHDFFHEKHLREVSNAQLYSLVEQVTKLPEEDYHESHPVWKAWLDVMENAHYLLEERVPHLPKLETLVRSHQRVATPKAVKVWSEKEIRLFLGVSRLCLSGKVPRQPTAETWEKAYSACVLQRPEEEENEFSGSRKWFTNQADLHAHDDRTSRLWLSQHPELDRPLDRSPSDIELLALSRVDWERDDGEKWLQAWCERMGWSLSQVCSQMPYEFMMFSPSSARWFQPEDRHDPTLLMRVLNVCWGKIGEGDYVWEDYVRSSLGPARPSGWSLWQGVQNWLKPASSEDEQRWYKMIDTYADVEPFHLNLQKLSSHQGVLVSSFLDESACQQLMKWLEAWEGDFRSRSQQQDVDLDKLTREAQALKSYFGQENMNEDEITKELGEARRVWLEKKFDTLVAQAAEYKMQRGWNNPSGQAPEGAIVAKKVRF